MAVTEPVGGVRAAQRQPRPGGQAGAGGDSAQAREVAQAGAARTGSQDGPGGTAGDTARPGAARPAGPGRAQAPVLVAFASFRLGSGMDAAATPAPKAARRP